MLSKLARNSFARQALAPQRFSNVTRNNMALRSFSSGTQMQAFKIYRYDPESQEKPKMEQFDINLKDCGPMILDAVQFVIIDEFIKDYDENENKEDSLLPRMETL